MTLIGSDEAAAFRENELSYSKAATTVLGRDLAKKYAGAKALIIALENYQNNKRQLKLIKGLKEGFDEKVKIEAIDIPRPEGEDESELTEEPVKKKDKKPAPYLLHKERESTQINKVIEGHPDCKLVIFLVELPRNVENLYVWQSKEEEKRPLVVVVFPAKARYLHNAITLGYIWVLTYLPDYEPDGICPADPQEAFDKRYVILTKENIKEFSEKHPDFFKK